MPIFKRPFPWIVLLFLVLAAGRVFSNLPWCDEGWFFDPLYNWITKGHTGTTIEEATGFPWEGIERHMYWQAPMHLLVQGLWVWTFGLNIYVFRACSVFAGLIALFGWRYLLRYIGLPFPILTLSLLLIATDYAFVRTASDGRIDMIASAFGLCAVVSYLHFRERNYTLAVLASQTFAVCGGLTHPMGGLIYLGYIAFFFLLKQDWRRLRWIHLPTAALPYLIGAACWGAYIMQEPETFKKIFFGSSAAGRLTGILHPLLSLQREIYLRYLVPNGWNATSTVVKMKVLIPFIYFAAIVAAVCIRPVRKLAHMRLLLVLWAIAFCGLYILDNQRNGTYLNHVFPLYAAVLATVLYWMFDSGKGMLRPVSVLLLAGVLLLQVGGSAYLIYTNPFQRDFMAAVRFVQQNAKPGSDHIVGSPELGFGLGFDNVLDDLTMGYHNRKKPAVIILDPRFRGWIETFRTWDPKLYQFVTDRLNNEYRRVYSQGTHEVYLPI
ncbi:MAG TPA: hypothetical protein VM120_04165 [Bryobacteraceae bacterium]|nr:hypothetical protein [Bryobacteraceae bacterium]